MAKKSKVLTNLQKKAIQENLVVPFAEMVERRRTHHALPKKKREYFAFLYWMTLPPTIRGMNAEIAIKEFGVDTDAAPILAIRTQKEFTEVFDVSEPTLAKWRQAARFEDDLDMARKRNISDRWMNRITESFSKATEQHADAPRVKLWMELFGNYQPTMRLSGNVTIDHNIHAGAPPPIMGVDQIFLMAIGKVCAQKGIDYGFLMNQLQQSYYKELNDDTTNEKQLDFKYPSDQRYNLDDVKDKVGKIIQEPPKAEELDITMSPMRRKLIEKLKKTEIDQRVDANVEDIEHEDVTEPKEVKPVSKVAAALKRKAEVKAKETSTPKKRVVRKKK